MKEIPYIRGSLDYVRQHDGSIFVVKIGYGIAKDARKLGVIGDIARMHRIGIKIVIVYTNPEAEPKRWISIKDFSKEISEVDPLVIKKYLALNLIPIFHCQEEIGLSSDEIVSGLASAVGAKKVIFITSTAGVLNGKKKLISEMSVDAAQNLLSMPDIVSGGMVEKIKASISACKRGVDRVHIINGLTEGALLRELFTCEGLGTMFYSVLPYQKIRLATTADIVAVHEVLEEAQVKVPLQFHNIDKEILDFIVFEVDKEVHGCVNVKVHNGELSALEVTDLAVSDAYSTSNVLQRLIDEVISTARNKRVRHVYLIKDYNTMWVGIYPWLAEYGFIESDLDSYGLPRGVEGKNRDIFLLDL